MNNNGLQQNFGQKAAWGLLDRVRSNFVSAGLALAMSFASYLEPVQAQTRAQNHQASVPSKSTSTKRGQVPVDRCQAEIEAFVVVDAQTMEILHEQNSDHVIQPASMKKAMTLLLVEEALAEGLTSRDALLSIIRPANIQRESGWKSPSRLGNMIVGAALRSFNDLTVTLAVHVAKVRQIGDKEVDFVALMNQRAKEIGMKNTMFYNSSGLPTPLIKSDSLGTTVFDMAILLKYIADHHPGLAETMGTAEAVVGRQKLLNTNTLLHKEDHPYTDVWGKTGMTCRAGSAVMQHTKLSDLGVFLVYVGAKDRHERERKVRAILNEVNRNVIESRRQPDLPEVVFEVEEYFDEDPSETEISFDR